MQSNLTIRAIDKGYLVLANENLVSNRSLNNISADWFNSDYWHKSKAIEGTSKGRYTTWFIKYQDNHWVLRHYWRGGLIANLSKDSYLYTGLNKTRAIAELSLLQLLYQEGFPVPKPVAAKVIRHGLCYQCDILIERVNDAKDLVAHLSHAPLSATQWQDIGICIAKFHNRGVYHADLNAKNILISPEGFHLIDFDRGEIRDPQKSWQQNNLNRLHRSFVKEKGKYPQLAFSENNWSDLLKGYHNYMANY